VDWDKINDVPTIVSFRNVYPKEVQDKVLANWVNYGYAPVAI
jgi:4-hydroxy-3-polyprenylbenzoate decarboxylase